MQECFLENKYPNYKQIWIVSPDATNMGKMMQSYITKMYLVACMFYLLHISKYKNIHSHD